MVDNNASFTPTWGETDPTASIGDEVGGLQNVAVPQMVSPGTRTARLRDSLLWAPREAAGKGPGVWALRLLAVSEGPSTLWTWVSCPSKAWHPRSWLHAAPSSGHALPGLGPSAMWTVRLVNTSCVPWALRTHQGPLLRVRILGRPGLLIPAIFQGRSSDLLFTQAKRGRRGEGPA